MLVLTRRIDQGIVISGNILIKVLGVERDRVKIGINAPLNVTVLRQELFERDKNSGGYITEPGPAEAQYLTGPIENQPLAYSGLGQGYCSGLSGMHSCQLDRIGLY